ncbi:MAG: hypothetical protein M1380_01820 [Chloroflexi bacterium]|nr:hypothetical protein [Chloroflexota bacterium]
MAKAAAKKAQVVLSEEQYQLLDEYAQAQGMTVSSLLRESLERTLIASLQRRRREAALSRLTGQQLPTANWDAIERELEERWTGHDIP